MDLLKFIQTSYTEKERLDRVNFSLEDLQGTVRVIPPMPRGKKRRGRKPMSGKERQKLRSSHYGKTPVQMNSCRCGHVPRRTLSLWGITGDLQVRVTDVTEAAIPNAAI